MNRERRAKISMAIDKIHTAGHLLSQAVTYISSVADGERDAFENLPENLQESDRFASMEDTADELETISSDLDDIVSRILELV